MMAPASATQNARTLHVGLRVSDIDRSLTFYDALGYGVVGSVPGTALGNLTMMAMHDDPFVTLELVHRPGGSVSVSGISHLVVRVESMTATVDHLAARGIEPEELTVHDPDTGFCTAWLVDPDGYRIELVQWPAGHAVGMTVEDFQPTQGVETGHARGAADPEPT
jgi:lactoylglutathione lyase